jgi:hypothetical protein
MDPINKKKLIIFKHLYSIPKKKKVIFLKYGANKKTIEKSKFLKKKKINKLPHKKPKSPILFTIKAFNADLLA